MRIAIIGGGAAGLMAAAAVYETNPDVEVYLIEKNNGLGKKVIISGGGRCNVTTGLRDIRQVLARYPRGGKFLNSAMRRFPPEAVYDWFESHGVPLKVEDDLRCFPQSNDGHDIVGAFERLFALSNVHVLLSRSVASVVRGEESGFDLTFKDGERLMVDRVIITTGGQAFRHTGSTGDGYAFAESLGHRITMLAPSLNSFVTSERWPQDVAGLSFGRAMLRTTFAQPYEFAGPVLFTHRGISGPAVFALSSLVAFERYNEAHPMEVRVDIFPDLSGEELRERLVGLCAEHPKKQLSTILDFLLSKGLVEVLCKELALNPQTHAAEVSKKDVQRVVDWLKGIPLHAIGRGVGDEFVTAGGVDLADIDPRTMESKLCPGLYFAGEVLDIDGFTGGFNLQASWAGGRVAGESAALS